MQVRTYDEVDPHEVYRLTMAAFGWPLTPKYVRHRLRRDPYVLEGFAIYAVERNRPVAQVVPLAMPVQLTRGVETVGAIQGVCSLTPVWGKGYARRLMEHAHDMYRQRGLRIATLVASRNTRGYGIYRKMGYVDLATFYRGTRRMPARRPKPPGLRLRKATRKDLPRIQSLFEAYTRGLYGWTQRDPRYLPMEVSWDRGVLDAFRIALRDGAAVGYLRVQPGWNVLATEVILPRIRDFRAAIRTLEAREKREFATVLTITSERERARYRAVGYDLYGPMMASAMAMPLGRRPRAQDLPRLFGARQGRFVLYETDFF